MQVSPSTRTGIKSLSGTVQLKLADLMPNNTFVPCRNLNYWDSVSTLAGEVPNPAKTFPRALFGAVILVTTTYALPLIVGLGVTTDIADWKLGYFASLAKQVLFTTACINI